MMLNPNLIHELDQVEAFSQQFAGMQRVYYMALIEQGMPDDLASDLTLQYGNLFWHFALEHITEEVE